MPLDALCISALTDELSKTLAGSRVDKIAMPARDALVFFLRTDTGGRRLLISAGADGARVHITETDCEKPPVPPMFCMLLRKHLSGARLTSVSQPGLERLITLVFEAYDPMGEACEKRLYAELIGRQANVVLVGPDGRIIDCLKRVDGDLQDRRQVLPGLFYRFPPGGGKTPFDQATPQAFQALLAAAPPEREAARWLLDAFFGLSPILCRELVYQCAGDTGARMEQVDAGRLSDAFFALREQMLSHALTPVMLIKEGRPFDICCVAAAQYGQGVTLERFESFSALSDAFYSERDRLRRAQARTHALKKLVSSARERTVRRLAAQRQELSDAQARDRYKLAGDLISANIYKLGRGMDSAALENYFDPEGKPITVALDPTLTPAQNAARYYKKYTRLKTADCVLAGQIAQGENELLYLDSVLHELEQCASDAQMEEIRVELSEGGYVKTQAASKKAKRETFDPMVFTSSSGRRFYAGRNNRQNDLLTMKHAGKRDVWLHTQKIPGSHVIIDCADGPPDDLTLTQAAQVAAYFSSARESHNVPVDYTAVKNVKKPPGAKPGMVIYDNYKTAVVTPDRELAEKLKSK